jgi:hypothetical protein
MFSWASIQTDYLEHPQYNCDTRPSTAFSRWVPRFCIFCESNAPITWIGMLTGSAFLLPHRLLWRALPRLWYISLCALTFDHGLPPSLQFLHGLQPPPIPEFKLPCRAKNWSNWPSSAQMLACVQVTLGPQPQQLPYDCPGFVTRHRCCRYPPIILRSHWGCPYSITKT